MLSDKHRPAARYEPQQLAAVEDVHDAITVGKVSNTGSRHTLSQWQVRGVPSPAWFSCKASRGRLTSFGSFCAANQKLELEGWRNDGPSRNRSNSLSQPAFCIRDCDLTAGSIDMGMQSACLRFASCRSRSALGSNPMTSIAAVELCRSLYVHRSLGQDKRWDPFVG